MDTRQLAELGLLRGSSAALWAGEGETK